MTSADTVDAVDNSVHTADNSVDSVDTQLITCMFNNEKSESQITLKRREELSIYQVERKKKRGKEREKVLRRTEEGG